MSPRVERGARVIRTNRGREKVYSRSGKLSQAFEWSAPLYEFDISHGLLLPDLAEEIDAMWHVVNFTPYVGLRMRHWGDYIGVKGKTSLVNISGNTWQLRRTYTFASITFHRHVKKPNSDVGIFTSGDAPCTFTLDTTTGIATVTSGTPSYWTGTFDYPVTFKDNEMVSRIEGTAVSQSVVPEPLLLEELRL